MRCKLLMVLMLLPATLLAGKFGVGGKVSMYDPPGDVGPTLMIGVDASYRFSDYIDAVGSVEWTKYKENGEDVTLMPMTINTRIYPLGRQKLDAYFGGGMGYYYREGVNVESTIGTQAILGVNWRPRDGKGVTFELKYTIPDINKPEEGGFTYSGGVTGTIDIGCQ